jgi:hypothetical protein
MLLAMKPDQTTRQPIRVIIQTRVIQTAKPQTIPVFAEFAPGRLSKVA